MKIDFNCSNHFKKLNSSVKYQHSLVGLAYYVFRNIVRIANEFPVTVSPEFSSE